MLPDWIQESILENDGFGSQKDIFGLHWCDDWDTADCVFDTKCYSRYHFYRSRTRSVHLVHCKLHSIR